MKSFRRRTPEGGRETFLVELGTDHRWVTAQFVGANSAVSLATFVLSNAPANDAVRYAQTVPGDFGSVVFAVS